MNSNQQELFNVQKELFKYYKEKDFLGKEKEDVIKKVMSFNIAQCKGILEFGLSSDQVDNPDYKKHTFIAILDIMKGGHARNYQDAFTMVEGLDKFEVGMVTVHGHTKEQVRDPDFRIKFVDPKQFTKPRNSRLRHLSSMSSFIAEKDRTNEQNPRKLSRQGKSV